MNLDNSFSKGVSKYADFVRQYLLGMNKTNLVGVSSKVLTAQHSTAKFPCTKPSMQQRMSKQSVPHTISPYYNTVLVITRKMGNGTNGHLRLYK
jgi:hypothetical protein